MTPLVLVLAAALAAEPADAPLTTVAPAPPVAIRRFTLVAGTNEGGSSRLPLRYATSDAQSFAQVLERLGGVQPADRLVLLEPRRADLLQGLERLGERMKAARAQSTARQELVFYYSGHSDEEGLLMRGERLGYSELRQAIDRLGADVRIGVLDSCSSGAFIRSKGGQHLPPFLVDTATSVRGHAFLTATTAVEAAQESDRIQGSYFTYALLAGLRGGADSSRDGRVTLSEAYQFAFEETLARTERSRGGPQHPAWDLQLAGTGDLVLTDLRGSSAGLVLDDDLDGRIYLRDGAGRLVAEVRKTPGFPMELGLESGDYKVLLDSPVGAFSAQVKLVEGGRTRLMRSGFSAVSKSEVAALRGAGDDVEALAMQRPHHVPFDFSIVGAASFNAFFKGPVINNFGLRLLSGGPTRLRGLDLSAGMSWVDEDSLGVQLTGAVAHAGTGAFGAQVAGALADTGGEMVGLQLAPVALARGGVRLGLQLSGFAYSGGSLAGLQVSGATIALGDVRGGQISGTVAWSSGLTAGLQLGGLLSYTRDRLFGVQVGALNYAGQAAGIQLGAVSASRTIDGLQVSGVNVAERAAGLQVGAVNIVRKASGLSVAAINVAEEADATIGVLNLVRNGYNRVSLTGDDFMLGSLTAKLGGRRVYSLLTLGGTASDKSLRWSTGAGIGTHLELSESIFVDVEGLGRSFYEDAGVEPATAALFSLRAVVGWQIFRHFAVIGGLSANGLVNFGDQDYDVALLPQSVVRDGQGRARARIFPGFLLGLQI